MANGRYVAVPADRKVRLNPAFRSRETGEIIITPGIHNAYVIPDFENAKTPADHMAACRKWEAGFTNADDDDDFWDEDRVRALHAVSDSQALYCKGVVI